MSSRMYMEDTSVMGRKEGLDIKVERIKTMLTSKKYDALYLTRPSNFTWITAWSSTVVTICTENGVAFILATRDGKRFVVTYALEEPRMKEEQILEQLGFEVISRVWFEYRNEEFIRKIVAGIEKVGADVPLGTAVMVQDKINLLRYSLTQNEICRYQDLGGLHVRGPQEVPCDGAARHDGVRYRVFSGTPPSGLPK
jgi:Xaa-Pro aminopeptidase